jgi:hypothetical protein
MKTGKFFAASYGFIFLALAGLIVYGRSYYALPPARKVRHVLHPILSQSGTAGHLLGIIGALFMLLLLSYSLRKRLRFMRNWGHLDIWLNVHIFLGLTAPALVLFHTDFEFGGIVGLSFWSMAVVVASGVVGRYIYRMIPRSLSGMELSRIELEAEEIRLTFEIRKFLAPSHAFWDLLAGMDRERLRGSSPRRIRARLNAALKTERNIEAKGRKKLLKLILAREGLLRRKQLLEKTLKMLHFWHLLHFPFVVLMFLILTLHVYITFTMGHRWIF